MVELAEGLAGLALAAAEVIDVLSGPSAAQIVERRTAVLEVGLEAAERRVARLTAAIEAAGCLGDTLREKVTASRTAALAQATEEVEALRAELTALAQATEEAG